MSIAHIIKRYANVRFTLLVYLLLLAFPTAAVVAAAAAAGNVATPASCEACWLVART